LSENEENMTKNQRNSEEQEEEEKKAFFIFKVVFLKQIHGCLIISLLRPYFPGLFGNFCFGNKRRYLRASSKSNYNNSLGTNFTLA